MLTLCALAFTTVVHATPVQLANPGFTGNAAAPAGRQSWTEVLSNSLRVAGVKVLPAEELSQVLGAEATTALSSCVAEGCAALARIPELDGLVQGSVGHLGSGYQVDVRVLQSPGGELMAVRSVQANNDAELYELLRRLAREIAVELFRRTGKEPVLQPHAEVSPEPPPEPSVVAPVAIAVLGAAALGTGIALDVVAHGQLSTVRTGSGITSYASAESTAYGAQRLSVVGAVLIGVGAAALAGGIGWWVKLSTGTSLLAAAPFFGPDGSGLMLTASWP